jgi:hypothetical protein
LVKVEFNFQKTFSNFINEVREQYTDFFENLEIELPPLESLSSMPPLDKDLGRRYEEEVLREVEERGIETVAVYVPYHVSRNWGIYIFSEKLNGLASYVARISNITFEDAFLLCRRAVIEHECFHFHTEYSATIVETVVQRSIYLPYFQSSRPYSEEEEAIANAWMLTSRAQGLKSIRPALEDICRRSPPGYRDYRRFLKNNNIIDYSKVKGFWTSRFLNTTKVILLPVRFEMPGSYGLTPIRYVGIQKAPELKDALFFILNNWRVEDVIKRLKKALPEEIVEASTRGIKLRTGRIIPVHYHPREGGTILVKLVNEVADNLGIERSVLRERILNLR